MKKRIRFHLLAISLLILISSGCSEKSDTKDKYHNYNETIEKYVLALIEKDYYTMTQYLPESSIQGDIELENVTEKDAPKETETRKIMGNRYAIYGFDYFYKEYGEIYYLIEYYNFKKVRNQIDKVVFGVKSENGKLIVFSVYGNHIDAPHFEQITNDRNYVTSGRMKSMLEKYPEHSFIAKEYPL